MHHNKSKGPRGGAAEGSTPRRALRAVAVAVALTSALGAGSAWALALGRVSVQSLLGEPLRAEIDVPSITEAEAASLQVGVAPPDRFNAASMAFNPVLDDVTFELVRNPNGRYVIRLTSNRVITEPFLDVVVQANWTNGQLLRGYTMLFDPPNLRPAPAPLLPAAPAAPVVVDVRPATPVPPAAVTSPQNTGSAPRPPATAAQAPAPTPASVTSVEVLRGDTASGIAMNHMPPGVSLDQMLIAMLRANPSAFVDNNVNRLRAGAILNLPDATAASAVPAGEARQLVQAQSRDFNEYRRRLASMAPGQDTPTATRQAAGVVQTEIADQQPAASAQDRLTLAQGATPTPEAERLAQTRQQEATQQRAEELNRNLQELERLREAASTPAPAATPSDSPAAQPTAAPGVTVEATAPAEPPAPPPAADPPAAPAPAAEAPAAPAPEAGSFIQSLIAHPYALPAGGGLVGLLALLGLLRLRKRKQDSALAADPEPDTKAYEQAEGQTVDTSVEAPVSSMMYSPSQLDAGGDVDPVAEADVYLAYGRDKQAEEILLEAIRLHPDRLPVRLKLLEIYAQRNDVAAFNAAAEDIHALTGGQGPDWQTAREAGWRVDPDNPLYASGAGPAAEEAPLSSPPDIDLNFDNEPTAQAREDDELDALLRGEAPDAANAATSPAPAAAEIESEPQSTEDGTRDLADLDFELDNTPASANPDPEPAGKESTLDFDLDLTELEPSSPAPAAPNALPQEVQDLSLDLDLDAPAASAPASAPDDDPMAGLELDEGLGGNDPLETKLSLAEEFQAIGDTDGARSLAEEVEAEASGALKERARAFLAQLS